MGLTVFLSYSRVDKELRDQLTTHLANLQRQGRIQAWHNGQIEAGTDWQVETEQQLQSAQVILLLISPNFMASDFCYEQQMQAALEHHRQGQTRVIPILLRPTDTDDAPFNHLQRLPRDGRAITQWEDLDLAFVNVVQDIRRVVAMLSVGAVTQRKRGQSLSPAVYHQVTWVERTQITPELLAVLKSPCRILVLSGITGIGKTALAERLVAEVQLATGDEPEKQACRFNLDDGGITADFASSGAAFLRSLGDEPVLADQQDPVNLLNHILDRLRSHPYLIQIDSLERLLQGNDQEGWSEFCDPLWLDLFQQILAGNIFRSQLLITTQDVPGELEGIGAQYPQHWLCEGLPGLNSAEQLELFHNIGVEDDADQHLQRIGRLYEGHPLVLGVIAADIKACGGDVTRYLKQCRFLDLDAQRPVQFSRRRLQRQVKQRVKESIASLPEEARQLLCRSAVYRRPVPESFWLAMLPDCGDEQRWGAISLLKSRGLAIEDWDPEQWLGVDGAVPLRQHNLIRGVAYELLKMDELVWQMAEHQAAEQWLTRYQPAPDVPHLETVRGYLDAFHHYCEGKDWDSAGELFMRQLKPPSQSQLWCLLLGWGYYQEQLKLCEQIAEKACLPVQAICQKGSGLAHLSLANYQQAITAFQIQRSLSIIQDNRNCAEEANALSNLGLAYRNMGEYQRAIDYHQEQLIIVRELGDPLGESNALCNLGLSHHSQQAIDFLQEALLIDHREEDHFGECCTLGSLGLVHYSLGDYEQAINFYKESLEIAQQIDRYREVGTALGNLGLAYYALGKYQKAMGLHHKHLIIVRQLKDYRGEANALGNLGIIYKDLREYDQAVSYAQQHLDLSIKIGDRQGEGAGLRELGAALLAQEKYIDSLEKFQEALLIFKELNTPNYEAEVLKDLAELQLKNKHLSQAREYCEAALQIARKLDIPMAEACQALLQYIEDSEV